MARDLVFTLKTSQQLVLETVEARRGCLLNDNDVPKNATGNIRINNTFCVSAWFFMFGI